MLAKVSGRLRVPRAAPAPAATRRQRYRLGERRLGVMRQYPCHCRTPADTAGELLFHKLFFHKSLQKCLLQLLILSQRKAAAAPAVARAAPAGVPGPCGRRVHGRSSIVSFLLGRVTITRTVL